MRTREEWLAILEGVTHGIVPEKGRPGIYDSAIAQMAMLETLSGWGDGSRILEIGSGNGRLAIPLEDRAVAYVGVEPIRECFDFAEAAFAGLDHIRFVHVDLRNGLYNPEGAVDPLQYRFPAGDGEVDLVILHSVFTHLERLDSCERYLEEARRVLRPRGKCWTTWFRSPPNEPAAHAARTVFRESDILNAIRDFRVIHTSGGLTSAYHDQWEIALVK